LTKQLETAIIPTATKPVHEPSNV